MVLASSRTYIFQKEGCREECSRTTDLERAWLEGFEVEIWLSRKARWDKDRRSNAQCSNAGNG